MHSATTRQPCRNFRVTVEALERRLAHAQLVTGGALRRAVKRLMRSGERSRGNLRRSTSDDRQSSDNE